MRRIILLLVSALLLAGCGGAGGTTASAGSTTGGSNSGAPTSYAVHVRVDTGSVHPQTVGPLSTITKVRVEIFGLGQATALLPAIEVPVTGATAEVTFSPVPLGSYTLQASGFNSVGTRVAGPISANVQVSSSALVQASLVLQVAPVVNDFLYITAADEIDVYKSDPLTGVLTPTPNSPFATPTGSRPDNIVAGPGGRFLYTNYFQLDQIARFQVDPTSGDLTLVDTVPTGTTPSGMCTDPQKEFLYVPLRGGGASVAVYRIDQTTGALTELSGSPFDVVGSTNPQRAYTDPQGRFLFVTDSFQNGELFVMQIDRNTGNLTQTVGPFQAFPITPLVHRTFAVTTNPAGTILYVAGNFNQIAVFNIDQTDGFLTPRANVNVTSTNLGELIYDANRSVLYALGFSDDVVRIFQLDGNGDVGAEVAGSPVLTGGIDPLTALLTPDGNRLYVANFQVAGQVSAFLPGTGGTLQPVTGQPFAAGLGPFGMAFLTFQTFP